MQSLEGKSFYHVLERVLIVLSNSRNDKLLEHNRNNHSPHEASDMIQCDECFTFSTRHWFKLNYHKMSKHSNESHPFKCLHPLCGMVFVNNSILQRHDLLHTGEKPFACECDQRFARVDKFHEHQKKCRVAKRATKKVISSDSQSNQEKSE